MNYSIYAILMCLFAILVAKMSWKIMKRLNILADKSAWTPMCTTDDREKYIKNFLKIINWDYVNFLSNK